MLYWLTLFVCVLFVSGCSAAGKAGHAEYHWEKNRTEILDKTDLALIYGGGIHRDVTWNAEHLAPYVTYVDEAGTEHWLFDGFLFLEISNGAKRIFATGYNGQPATQEEWTKLVDYYFTPGNGVCALDECVALAAERLGQPPVKPRVVMVIPEPIVGGPDSHYKEQAVDYWGTVDDARLDFTRDEDRIAACKWYIDYVSERFNECGFANVELDGFYWLAEEVEHTATILNGIAEYLHGFNYSFNWIPYWKTQPDYLDWRSYGFDYTYLQPNYFFSDNTPYSRLESACGMADEYDLDLELEFDNDVFAEGKNRGARLYDYMNAYRENGMLANKRIAYYMDTDTLYKLYKSTNADDKRIFHDFCSFVLEHKSAYKK